MNLVLSHEKKRAVENNVIERLRARRCREGRTKQAAGLPARAKNCRETNPKWNKQLMSTAPASKRKRKWPTLQYTAKNGTKSICSVQARGAGPRPCQRSWAWVFYSCRYKWRTVASQLLHSCLTVVSQLSLIWLGNFVFQKGNLNLNLFFYKQNVPHRSATTVRQL